jgi:Icc-related predicted phosphoesterase
MSKVVIRNAESEQYICAARKNFKTKNEISESTSKMLICHFSDIHGDLKRFNNILELINYYKPDFAVHTGDMPVWNSDDDIETDKTNINQILIQDLADDNSYDITELVKIEKDKVIVSGDLITKFGTHSQPQYDTSEPGVVICLKK